MTKQFLTYHNTKEKKEDGIILILSIRLCSLQAKDFESHPQFNKIINGKDFVAQNAYTI
jgi:hypothetical protein